MTTERTIYAVVFSNYDPPEVDSLYAEREDAEARVEELHREPMSSAWNVVPMTLVERAVTDPLAEGAP